MIEQNDSICDTTERLIVVSNQNRRSPMTVLRFANEFRNLQCRLVIRPRSGFIVEDDIGLGCDRPRWLTVAAVRHSVRWLADLLVHATPQGAQQLFWQTLVFDRSHGPEQSAHSAADSIHPAVQNLERQRPPDGCCRIPVDVSLWH